jgi:hypothetical protein
MKALGNFLATSAGSLAKQIDNEIERLEKFSYDVLAKQPAIRLLQIQSYDESKKRVSISLETFPLNEAPQYHALSYTRGDPFSTPNFKLRGMRRTLASGFQGIYKGRQ